MCLESRFQDGWPLDMLICTAQDRLMVVIEGEGRKPPKANADRVALFDSLTAYTGIYRVEGDRPIFKADVASSPSLRGAEVGRLYRLDGDRLGVIQDPGPAANLPGNPIISFVSVWQRGRWQALSGRRAVEHGLDVRRAVSSAGARPAVEMGRRHLGAA